MSIWLKIEKIRLLNFLQFFLQFSGWNETLWLHFNIHVLTNELIVWVSWIIHFLLLLVAQIHFVMFKEWNSNLEDSIHLSPEDIFWSHIPFYHHICAQSAMGNDKVSSTLRIAVHSVFIFNENEWHGGPWWGTGKGYVTFKFVAPTVSRLETN